MPGLARRLGQDREILALAVPAFGALVAEPAFLLADSIIVGRLGTVPLGALGVAGQALNTLVNLCIFLAYGTTAAVARQLGAGRTRAALRQGIDGVWLALLIGIAIAGIGSLVAPDIIALFGAPRAVAGDARDYLRISLLGIPSMLIVLAGTGVLRGLQNTKVPLLVAVGQNALNITLNAVFVLILHGGIAGSAWGTVLAQTAGACCYLMMIAKGAMRYGVPLAPDLTGLRAAATAGVALLIRTLGMRVVLVVATALAARMGTQAIAAHQVASNIWAFLTFALDALAIAGQAITGRYLGAGDAAGARRATARITGWGIGCGAVFALAVAVLAPVLPGLFSADRRVQVLLTAVLLVVAATQPVSGVVFVLDGVLIGAGDQRYLAVASVLTMIGYLVAAGTVIAIGGGLVALWLANACWMVLRLVALGPRARGDRWLILGPTAR